MHKLSGQLMGPPVSTKRQRLTKEDEDLLGSANIFAFGDVSDTASIASGSTNMDVDDDASSLCDSVSSRTGSEAASLSSLAMKPCAACDEESVGKKSRYCARHRRAFESIQRQAMKGVLTDPDTKAQVDTDESKAFKQIFGFKNKNCVNYEPDDDLGALVLTNFLREYPDGNEKSTKQRGKLDLCQFVEKKGSRVSNDAESKGFKWDKDFSSSGWASFDDGGLRKAKWNGISSKVILQLIAIMEGHPSRPCDCGYHLG